MSTATARRVDAGDLGLHVAARTVIGRCPTPINALEVAVILETCGYTANRARQLGYDSVPALARGIYALLPLYSCRPDDTPQVVPIGVRLPGAVDFARGFAYSAPWLVGLATLLISGVSFWSSNVAIPSIANSVSLASAAALLLTGPFIQAFGRRASFYIGLNDQGMVLRITRWTLELGLLVTAASCVALFSVRNDVLGVGTPASTRMGIAAGLAIAGLQLGLAAFYIRRAFLSAAAIVVAGAGALVWIVSTHHSYLDPTALIVWQVRLVAVMAAMCWVASAWWLLRVSSSAPAPLWRPSGTALLRAVAPYSSYGLAFFAIVVGPQLVSGGLLQGRYSFNPQFAATSGIALVVLIPLMAQTVAATEHLLSRQFPGWLEHFRVAEIDGFRREVRGYWLRQLVLLVGLAVAACAAIIVEAPRLGTHVALLTELHRHPGLLAACTVGYVMLGIGIFCSQLLFTLSAPARPLISVCAGLTALVTASAVAGGAGPTVSAAAGLLAGAFVFGATALVLAHTVFSRADHTYYRAL
jgi:hypothetical protein